MLQESQKTASVVHCFVFWDFRHWDSEKLIEQIFLEFKEGLFYVVGWGSESKVMADEFSKVHGLSCIATEAVEGTIAQQTGNVGKYITLK